MANAEQKTTAEEQPAVEKQTNCLSCNKPLKKVRIYYRDGKFYCTKRCWLKFTKKKSAPEGEGAK
ncbi:MAG: LIM domain-containing protein [Candidatus Omnitrophota bacterium]